MEYRINMTGANLEDAQNWATMLREEGLNASWLFNDSGDELWLAVTGLTLEDADALTAEIEDWTRTQILRHGRHTRNYRQEQIEAWHRDNLRACCELMMRV